MIASPSSLKSVQNPVSNSDHIGKLARILDQLQAKKPKDFKVFIISKARHSNVSKMHKLCGTDILPTWIVGKGEAGLYIKNGAVEVFEGGGLCKSRNKALQLAQEEGKYCVQLSDDIRWCEIQHVPLEDRIKYTDIKDANQASREHESLRVNPLQAARYIEVHMRQHNVFLGGAYCTVNKGQGMRSGHTSLDLFIVGDFLVIHPRSELRFDESMTLKEDYDFTAQHLKRYKKVVRMNRVYISARHYKNAGGAVDVRNPITEQRNIKILQQKWPGVFRINPRRGENEVWF